MIESAILNTELDHYWSLIKNASDEIKLKLISRLSLSIETRQKSKTEDIDSIFGSWSGPESAEEIIAIIKENRSSKKPPMFD